MLAALGAGVAKSAEDGGSGMPKQGRRSTVKDRLALLRGTVGNHGDAKPAPGKKSGSGWDAAFAKADNARAVLAVLRAARAERACARRAPTRARLA